MQSARCVNQTWCLRQHCRTPCLACEPAESFTCSALRRRMGTYVCAPLTRPRRRLSDPPPFGRQPWRYLLLETALQSTAVCCSAMHLQLTPLIPPPACPPLTSACRPHSPHPDLRARARGQSSPGVAQSTTSPFRLDLQLFACPKHRKSNSRVVSWLRDPAKAPLAVLCDLCTKWW